MNTTPTEYIECCLLVEYLNIKNIKHAHIHNEMYTKSWKQKLKAKKLGVSSGVPDYLIFASAEQTISKKPEIIFIEMKRQKGGTLSANQKEWLELLSSHSSVHTKVCKGFEPAKEFLETIIS